MNLLTARYIFQKEMLDTFRDKRTMIAMVGIPIILYPALFILSIQMILIQESKMDETVSKIALLGPDIPAIRDLLAETEQVVITDEFDYPEQALEDGDLHAVVKIADTFNENLEAEGSAEITILYDQIEPKSRKALDRVSDALTELNKTLLESRLSENELPEGFAKPLKLGRDNIATAEKTTGTLLGTILPLIMVMMLGIGAFYPAVDLTAGEKERGTFETLLSTPATKLEIVIGKFFAVFSLSMLTGLLNLASMTVTFYFQLTQFVSQRELLPEGQQLLSISISPTTVAAIALLLVPLAFFISAIMMSVAVLARSFKEAQNYVTPIFILIIMPVAAVSFPGVELNSTTQFIPISNISLLFRDLLAGQAQMQYFFTVFVCTSIYALISLVIATWMFQSEEVILSEDKGIPITLDRRAFTPSQYPTLGTSLGIFAIVMLLLFYIGAYAQAKNIHSGTIITQYLLILAPVILILRYIKVDLKSALNLKAPAPLSAVAVIVTTIPWILINFQIGTLQNKVLPIPEEFAEVFETLLLTSSGDKIHVLLLLFIIAISPAICEEILFRGVITSGLRRVLNGWATILVVGVLFGLFHMSIYRVLGTGLLGILLTYFVIRSGSILLPVLAHFINNAIGILLATETIPKSWITYIEKNNIEENGLPIPWIITAAIVFTTGIILFEKTLPKSQEPLEENPATNQPH